MSEEPFRRARQRWTRSGPLKNGFRVNHISEQAEGVPRDAELFTPVVCRRDRQRDALARAPGCRDLHLRGHPIDRLGRSGMPMLFIGTIAGVVGEALNRKRLLVTQLCVMAVSSSVLCALAFSAQIR